LAEEAGISDRDAAEIIAEVVSAVEGWPEHTRRAGVGRSSLEKIETALEPCLARARPA